MKRHGNIRKLLTLLTAALVPDTFPRSIAYVMLTPLQVLPSNGGARVASSAPTLDGEALFSLGVGFPSYAWAGLMRKPGGKSAPGKHVSMLVPQFADLVEKHGEEGIVSAAGAELWEHKKMAES